MRNSNATLFSVAPFTVTALAINVGVYVLSAVMSKDPMSMNINVLAALGASMRERLWEGEWVRLIAPMFLHGGILHIFMNMNFLWRAGPDAEIHFGTPNFGTIYLLSGATGVCLSQIFGGHLSIGASGSLCGIMAAHLAVLVLQTPVWRNAWRSSKIRSQSYSMLILLGIGLLPGINFDNWGHFGGMLAGFVLGGSFELWRERRVAGKLGVFASLLAIGALVCAARWTVFNPTYHLYQAAYAKEELKDPEAEKFHAAEALRWAGVWTPLHFLGVLNPAETAAIQAAYERGQWNHEVAFDPRLSMQIVIRIYKKGAMPFSLVDIKRKLDDRMAY